MPVVYSNEIDTRDDFDILCNWRKLFRAVEIGVDRAEFATRFLSGWKGHNYLGVDPYLSYPEFPWNREADYLFAVARLERLNKNCKLIRETSETAAKLLRSYTGGYFADLTHVDFIYLDGDHSELWLPLISEIGILAGHDYDDSHPEVMKAVDECLSDKFTIRVTKDSPASWYIYLNEVEPSWNRICVELPSA
jgi:hypothetical protein